MTTGNHYIYAHTAVDGSFVYVGLGQQHRCLDQHRRKPEHATFMQEAMNDRGLEFVTILHKGITHSEAREIERDLILKHRPRFNVFFLEGGNAGSGADNHNSVFTPEEVQAIRAKYDEWAGSMRSFHREHLSRVGWVAARKLMLGLSYKELTS